MDHRTCTHPTAPTPNPIPAPYAPPPLPEHQRRSNPNNWVPHPPKRYRGLLPQRQVHTSRTSKRGYEHTMSNREAGHPRGRRMRIGMTVSNPRPAPSSALAPPRPALPCSRRCSPATAGDHRRRPSAADQRPSGHHGLPSAGRRPPSTPRCVGKTHLWPCGAKGTLDGGDRSTDEVRR